MPQRFYPEFDMMLNQAFAQLVNKLAAKGNVVRVQRSLLLICITHTLL